MRQRWAKFIAFLSGLLVLLLSVVFAIVQNPVELSDSFMQSRRSVSTNELQEIAGSDNQLIESGRKVYQKQGCMRCHSIAGKGNPRNPLDGVGGRRSADELRNWVTGKNVQNGELPEYVSGQKQRYAGLSEDDLNALLVYMQSLHL